MDFRYLYEKLSKNIQYKCTCYSLTIIYPYSCNKIQCEYPTFLPQYHAAVSVITFSHLADAFIQSDLQFGST